MKFCKKAFEHMYVNNSVTGSVWPCAWLNARGRDFCMGNILEQSVDEIFNSDTAKRFRESILDGSYRYCSTQECCDLANGWLPDLSEEEIKEIISNREPKTFVMAYEETCNHACPSCRHEYYKGSEEYYNNVDKIGKKLIPYLNKSRIIDANGRGEIMISEHMLRTLDEVKPIRDDFTFFVETNAALFDEAHFKRIEHLTQKTFEVIATVNSFNDTTYRCLNGYANHVDQVIDNLYYMRSLREKEVINRLIISMVVQEANFRELPQYVERCLNDFKADQVRLRGIMQFSMEENEFWYKDVFNPANPCYREAMDIIHLPIMQDERVWYWEGDYENVRIPKLLPMSRFRDYYELLFELVKMDSCGDFANKIHKLRGKKFGLWGARQMAEYLLDKFRENGIEPVAIFDSNALDGDFHGIELIHISNDKDRLQGVEMILNTAPFYTEDIEKTLELLDFKGCFISIKELFEIS